MALGVPTCLLGLAGGFFCEKGVAGLARGWAKDYLQTGFSEALVTFCIIYSAWMGFAILLQQWRPGPMARQ